jgi:hypothetical protein
MDDAELSERAARVQTFFCIRLSESDVTAFSLTGGLSRADLVAWCVVFGWRAGSAGGTPRLSDPTYQRARTAFKHAVQDEPSTWDALLSLVGDYDGLSWEDVRQRCEAGGTVSWAAYFERLEHARDVKRPAA